MTGNYEHKILLVDDEQSILKSLKRLLMQSDLPIQQIFAADSGLKAVEMLRQFEKPVSLIISDQRMPEMKGAQFLEQAKKISPDSMRFLLTAYSELDAVSAAVNKGGIHRYINKSWSDDDLIFQIAQALEQYELKLENKRLLEKVKKQNIQLYKLNLGLEKKVQERTEQIKEKNTLLETNLFNTVRSFASLVGKNGPEMEGHGKRVAFLASETAKVMKLSKKQVTHVEIAGFLHDIGKIGMPEKILQYKERQWSVKERHLFETHPVEGRNIVQFIDSLDEVGDMIQSHHEKFNGTGFPDRLHEDSIVLGARIIAVADIYDKITQLKKDSQFYIKEYYKERDALTDTLTKNQLLKQAALHHLKQQAFTWYDPEVVKAFITCLKNFGVQEKGEKQIRVSQLKPGMILSRPLFTDNRNRFLLPFETVLTSRHIEKITTIHGTDPVTQVYCKTT